MTEAGGTVLVTGGTGFLGGWCIAVAAGARYDVRTTVRDLAREEAVRDAVESGRGRSRDRGSRCCAADLASDDGWAEAVAGCRYVLHVASPFPPVQPKDPDELIVPARDGALRVLGAALDAGRRARRHDIVDRGGPPGAAQLGGRRRTPRPTGPTATTPRARRTRARRRSPSRPHGSSCDDAGAEDRLATINPGAIIGPALNDDHSYSLQAIQRLLDGMPAVPRLGFTFVDVRDVADLHIRALTDPAAGGERFIATDRFLWMAEVATILRERLGDAAAKVPTRVAPNLLVRAMALFDGSIRSVVGDLGKQSWFSSEKARTSSAGQRGPSRTRSRTARAA